MSASLSISQTSFRCKPRQNNDVRFWSYSALLTAIALIQTSAAMADDLVCKAPKPVKRCVTLDNGEEDCRCAAAKVIKDPPQTTTPGSGGGSNQKVDPPVLLRIEPGLTSKPGEIQVPDKTDFIRIEELKRLEELKVEQLRQQDGGAHGQGGY